MSVPHYHVVAAIICHDGRVLCVQKGWMKQDYLSYKYELPGGKIEDGEAPEEALRREVMEELGLDIDVGEAYLAVTHAYPDFTVTLRAYLSEAQLIDTLTLKEHIHFQWLYPTQLTQLHWTAADLPIINKLQKSDVIA